MTVTLLDPGADVAAHGYWRGVEEIPPGWGRSVVTLGVFDGLHRGHVRLLERAVDLGRRRGLPVVLATFDPHPARITGPPRDTTPLVDLDRRAELAREHGADAVLVLPFCETMARTPAVGFAVDVLVRALHATDVVVGENFRFGHRGAGDVGLLRQLGARHGFTAHGVPLVPGCSSTRVRSLVATGDVAGAVQVLGRPHRVEGHARGGRVEITGEALLPPPGRYRVRVDGAPATVIVAGRAIELPAADGPVRIDFVGDA